MKRKSGFNHSVTAELIDVIEQKKESFNSMLLNHAPTGRRKRASLKRSRNSDAILQDFDLSISIAKS